MLDRHGIDTLRAELRSINYAELNDEAKDKLEELHDLVESYLDSGGGAMSKTSESKIEEDDMGGKISDKLGQLINNPSPDNCKRLIPEILYCLEVAEKDATR